MKIGNNELLKAGCIQAAAVIVAAHDGTPDVEKVIDTAEALYLKWLETERRQHTHDLSF